MSNGEGFDLPSRPKAYFSTLAGVVPDEDRQTNSDDDRVALVKFARQREESSDQVEIAQIATSLSPPLQKFDKKEYMKIYMRDHRRGILRRGEKNGQ